VLHYYGLDCGLFEFFKYFTPPKESCLLSGVFWRRFVEKEAGLRTYNPTAEEGSEVFL
jgi:hypothetical protein